MSITPYITRCNMCGKPTWYETEQPCKMTYKRMAICDLGHEHEELDEDDMPIYDPCPGTLKLIDPTA